MEINPPLLLLFDVPQSEVRVKFDAFVAASPRFSIDQLGQAEKSHTTVVVDGLSFLCDWNTPSTSIPTSRKIFSTFGDEAVQSTMGFAPHPHIGGGLRIPEIAQAFLALGATFAKQLGSKATFWKPSSLQTDPDYFTDVVEAYVKGGVFPVLPIIDFQIDSHILRSNGLHLFCGQEFELQSDKMEHQELIRRAIRLAHDLATNGPVEFEQDVPDLDSKNIIHLAPNANGHLLSCRIKSSTERIVNLN